VAQQVSCELAVIMFTDIVDYTAMMQSDENHGYQMRKRNRKVVKNLIENNQGQQLQYFGSGVNIASRVENLSVAGGILISAGICFK
jgi:class 3 adenylate cyclase